MGFPKCCVSSSEDGLKWKLFGLTESMRRLRLLISKISATLEFQSMHSNCLLFCQFEFVACGESERGKDTRLKSLENKHLSERDKENALTSTWKENIVREELEILRKLPLNNSVNNNQNCISNDQLRVGDGDKNGCLLENQEIFKSQPDVLTARAEVGQSGVSEGTPTVPIVSISLLVWILRSRLRLKCCWSIQPTSLLEEVSCHVVSSFFQRPLMEKLKLGCMIIWVQGSTTMHLAVLAP